MPPIRVVVIDGVEPAKPFAEFWVGDERIGVTVSYDGRLHVRLEPRADGDPWLIGVATLMLALENAASRIEGTETP